MKISHTSSFLSILSLASAQCFPPGNVFTFPKNLSKDGLSALAKNITGLVDDLLKSEGAPTLFNGTTFSIEMTTPSESFFEYHHKGALTSNSTQEINGDSIYRIGSNTKTFVALLLLRAREKGLVRMEDPVTKFIPELEGDDTEIDWNQVTMKSLAGHLGGLAREGGWLDMLALLPIPDPTAIGLPPPPPVDQFSCGSIPGAPECNEENLIKYMKGSDRTYHTWDRPTYSNSGFSLLGIALAHAFNSTLKEVFENEVYKPLKMASSSMTAPEKNGVIPSFFSDWQQDLGSVSAAGAQYSSTHDFAKFHRSMLKYEILPEPVVHEWLKPVSWAGGIDTAYGIPWEIIHFQKFTSSNRTVTAYTKGGSVRGFFSWQFILPDYGIGGIILTASRTPAAQSLLLDGILSTAIPQLEDIARQTSKTKYTGSYKAKDLNSSITIEVEDSGPGMTITQLISNNTDMLQVIKGLPSSGGMPAPALTSEAPIATDTAAAASNASTSSDKNASAAPKPGFAAKLFPTDFYDTDDGEVQFRIAFTKALSPSNNANNLQRKFSLPPDLCFNDVGGFTYGGKTLLQVIFKFEKGQVKSVKLPGFRVELERQSGGYGDQNTTK